jgi:hypothetical protein
MLIVEDHTQIRKWLKEAEEEAFPQSTLRQMVHTKGRAAQRIWYYATSRL